MQIKLHDDTILCLPYNLVKERLQAMLNDNDNKEFYDICVEVVGKEVARRTMALREEVLKVAQTKARIKETKVKVRN